MAIVAMLACAACKGFFNNDLPQGVADLSRVGNFDQPVYVAVIPGDTARLFVVEQAGIVRELRHDSIQTRPLLNLTGRIASGGERGLLCIAFDPQFATNGRFFVYFTDHNGDLRIVRYTVSSDRDSTDEATADTILAIPHPGQANHNGGQLQFGPDNMLWIGTGDGGGSGDPGGNSQNKHALLGKLLRLDVSGASGYTIPAGNPGVNDTAFAPEVWAYGLRNPWRFSFDRQSGDLYIGDVGENNYEEVDLAPAAVQRGPGANYGWNIMEGKHCLVDGCTQAGIPPVVEYAHSPNVCSVTGGYVYRGSAIPGLDGHYFFADFCAGTVKSINWPSVIVGDWSSQLS
ncbi:MAG: glucose dehydrogenase, partial [Gemmatimonadetes bacterium]